VWSWDWLGNMTEWSDDAQQFYERSIGDITNGQDVSARPSALYVASSIDPMHPESSGWVELDYGVGGNVTAVTVHGQCMVTPSIGMGDPCSGSASAVQRQRCELRTSVLCTTEQHYQYRWDELNRISEARRFDRSGGMGAWTIEARQRYRYDGANVRVVKQSFDTSENAGGLESTDQRVALYVYPGDVERRGLRADNMSMSYAAVIETSAGTETQYLVAGARMVWHHGAPVDVENGPELERDWRATIAVGDLLNTTAASIDLISGELLEVSTYYPNGGRETLWAEGGGETGGPSIPLEPMGFTEKEADAEVGLIYHGQRYLVANLGRWANADPLCVHSVDGVEAMNAYHYVSGNLLQARDPMGLWQDLGGSAEAAASHREQAIAHEAAEGGHSESFSVLGRVEFEAHTVEAYQRLNEHEWAVAREHDAGSGGTRLALFHRASPDDEWTRYDACAYDRCGSASDDPIGNGLIAMAGSGGLSLLLAGARGAVTLATVAVESEAAALAAIRAVSVPAIDVGTGAALTNMASEDATFLAQTILEMEHPTLASEVAQAAVSAPAGVTPTSVLAVGANVEGPDVIVQTAGATILRDVTATQGSFGGFRAAVAGAGRALGGPASGIEREAILQVPRGTDVARHLARFRGMMAAHPELAQSVAGLHVRVYSETGEALLDTVLESAQ
jgi:RHS repeat-associated protein